MAIEHDMRVRFHAALAERDAILVKTVDLHAEAQALAEQEHALRDEREALMAKIIEIEAPARELQTEMNMLCRALDNKTALPEHEG